MKSRSGFTIVELLIVIVVIAILATISIVAYNGIKTRAENNKTIAAATAYYKAMKLYEVDKGEVPHFYDLCLGENYPWDFTGNSSGANQCFYASMSYYKVNATFNTMLRDYTGGNLPEPSMQTAGTSTAWGRGITYAAQSVGGNFILLVALKSISTCPTISGQSQAGPPYNYGDDKVCVYSVGKRLR